MRCLAPIAGSCLDGWVQETECPGRRLEGAGRKGHVFCPLFLPQPGGGSCGASSFSHVSAAGLRCAPFVPAGSGVGAAPPCCRSRAIHSPWLAASTPPCSLCGDPLLNSLQFSPLSVALFLARTLTDINPFPYVVQKLFLKPKSSKVAPLFRSL